jgi:hypothetical protein
MDPFESQNTFQPFDQPGDPHQVNSEEQAELIGDGGCCCCCCCCCCRP